MRHQKRLQGRKRGTWQRRARLSSCVEHAIDAAVRREAARYGVSLSYVQKVHLAAAFGIALDAGASYKAVAALRVIQGGRRDGKRIGGRRG